MCTRLFTGRTFYNSEVQFVMKSFLFKLFSTVKVHSIKTCQLIDVNCLPFFSLLCHCYSSINGVNSDYFALIFNQRYHNRCPLTHPYLLIKSPQYTGGDFMFLYRFVRRRRRRRRPQILVQAITFEQLFGFLSFLAQLLALTGRLLD